MTVKKATQTDSRALISDMITWLGQYGYPWTDEQLTRIHGTLESLGTSEEDRVAMLGEVPVAAATTTPVDAADEKAAADKAAADRDAQIKENQDAARDAAKDAKP